MGSVHRIIALFVFFKIGIHMVGTLSTSKLSKPDSLWKLFLKNHVLISASSLYLRYYAVLEQGLVYVELFSPHQPFPLLNILA